MDLNLWLKRPHAANRSLPTRKCGLKLSLGPGVWGPRNVTSYTEVWIEIKVVAPFLNLFTVTSYTEVWIEIPCEGSVRCPPGSLPTRKCGLKSKKDKTAGSKKESLPTRKCGLKCIQRICSGGRYKSLPTRKCGLKFHNLFSRFLPVLSLPTRKCGLKYTYHRLQRVICPGHFLHGSVD